MASGALVLPDGPQDGKGGVVKVGRDQGCSLHLRERETGKEGRGKARRGPLRVWFKQDAAQNGSSVRFAVTRCTRG